MSFSFEPGIQAQDCCAERSSHVLEQLVGWELGVGPLSTSGTGVPLLAPLGPPGEPLGCSTHTCQLPARAWMSVTIRGCQPADITRHNFLSFYSTPQWISWPLRTEWGRCQEACSTVAASALQGLVMFQVPAPRLRRVPPLLPGYPIPWGSCPRPAVSLLPYAARGNGFHSCVSEATADSKHVLDLCG